MLRLDLRIRQQEINWHAAAATKYMPEKTDYEAVVQQVAQLEEAHAVATQQCTQAGGAASGQPAPAMPELPEPPKGRSSPGHAPELTQKLKKQRDIQMVFITKLMSFHMPVTTCLLPRDQKKGREGYVLDVSQILCATRATGSTSSRPIACRRLPR